MITPRFSCRQTAASVIVSIYCPSVRASDVEINVDDTLLTVHIHPYFLRLNFSNAVLEDDDSSANYEPSSGYLTVTLTKAQKGLEFQDLDLLAKLLAPRPVVNQPVIEVISTEDSADNVDEEGDDLVASIQELSIEQREILEASENDWQLPQTVPEAAPDISLSTKATYGFLDMHSGYFSNVGHTENEVHELANDAESCSTGERRRRRLQHEDEKWDEEHYLADYADDEYIQELLSWKHPHCASDDDSFEYTEREKLLTLNLPRKEYIPTSAQTRNLYLTLLNLLFSYAYESRTNQHDPTPESAWTICSLTPAFSALDPAPYVSDDATHPPSTPQTLEFSPSEISATLVPSYRRSLAFPLYRSFALAEACRLDVAGFLSKGKRTVFRCLLEMKHILDHHEVYYVYSKIWLDDFSVWAQAYASDEVFSRLGDQLRDVQLKKSLIGWGLEELEAVVLESVDRESDSDDD